MNILPGIGIGDIKFGVYEQDVTDALGKPDRVDEAEYVEGTGDFNRELWYSHKNLTFTFDLDDNYKLGVITIMGIGYPLFGKELFGATFDKVRKLIVSETGEIPRYEDWSSEELPEHTCLIHDALGIMFWFDFGVLSQMQCSYLFEDDNETVVWPIHE